VAFAQGMTAYFLVETTAAGLPVLQDYRVYLIIFSTVLITAAGYMINDYYDVKIDYVNRPHEVVVGKGIKRRVVIFLHSLINFSAIGLGYLVSPRIALVNFVAAFLLWLYSNRLKRKPFTGNLTVAFLTGFSVYLIGYYYQKSELLVLTYSIFAFFSNLIREIIKDTEDIKGDSKFNANTLPIKLGIKHTKQILFYLQLCFILMCLSFTILFPAISNVGPLASFEFITYISLLVIIPSIYLLFKLWNADTKKHFTHLSFIAKIIMLLGIFSMVFWKTY
jgi:4-hydroxybenzoate polyprenyltransferase